MKCIVTWVIAGHDSANDFAVPTGQKQGGVTVLVEWVPFSIEKCFALDQERRDPRRVILVDSPRKFDEGVALRARTDLGNFDLRHDELISAAAARCARPK